MAEKCGCAIVKIFNRSTGGTELAVQHCPKHAAVDDLLAALEAITQHPLKHVTDRDGSWSAVREGDMIRAQHAVAKAGGNVS